MHSVSFTRVITGKRARSLVKRMRRRERWHQKSTERRQSTSRRESASNQSAGCSMSGGANGSCSPVVVLKK